MTEAFVPTIGLEIHVQINTETKLFCNCPNRFGDPPNTNVCEVCTGQPGVLPVLNRNAWKKGLRTGLTLNCKIADTSRFARKHYAYPDLPRNYQITQYDQPLAEKGALTFDTAEGEKSIGIERVHLEEDAGKLTHNSPEADQSHLDLNRAGVPLLEIVTRPDLTGPAEAKHFMRALRRVLRHVDVSNCDMEKGELRVDSNISVAPPGEQSGERVEIKNLNSFRNMQNALAYEENRQAERRAEGKRIEQETRGYDPDAGETVVQRSKEYQADYRYFSEPDLPPLKPDPDLIENLREHLPEKPRDRRNRFRREYDLKTDLADRLVENRRVADFYEASIQEGGAPDSLANLITGPLQEYLNDRGKTREETELTPQDAAGLVRLLEEDRLTYDSAKEILPRICSEEKGPEEVMVEEDLEKMDNQKNLRKAAKDVIRKNPGPVKDYRRGKEEALEALMGPLMQKTGGRADPRIARELFRELVEEKKE